MDTEGLSNQIIELPATLKSDPSDKSAYSVLREIGYFQFFEKIDKAAISDALRKRPECIKLWIQWSQDKRTNSGWYLEMDDNGDYVVGHFPDNGLGRSTYPDPIAAAAEFIKLEIEDIRTT